MNDLFSLAGKNILITGSAQGIGVLLATGLGKYGAQIIINDFNIWFRRALVNKRFREDFKDMNLELRLSDNFNDVDRFITNVALDEGVFFQSKLETPGKVIRISRSSFEYPKGIGFKTS